MSGLRVASLFCGIGGIDLMLVGEDGPYRRMGER